MELLPLAGAHSRHVLSSQLSGKVPARSYRWQGWGGLSMAAAPFLCILARGQRRSSGSSGGTRAVRAVKLHAQAEPTAPPVPVVLLSGFLGTGKTTLLRHWLENSTDRVGIVVNDVAAVNIDSKLVQQEAYNAEGEVNAIQLQNGCACCSLGDELLVSISDLLELAAQEKPFDKIVVELSGVAEPKRVLENFEQAKSAGYYAVNGFELSKVVTLLDASTFCEEYMEYQMVQDRDDLVDGDLGEMADCSVVELLVEQAEAADVVVLNKTDLASKEQLETTRAVVKAINTKASIVETSYGRLSLDSVMVQDGHSHAHEHGGHEEHGHSHASDCSEPSCSDVSHGHGHSHASDCDDPTCSDPSHGHSHSHSHAEDCSDPECTDASHGHSHSHSHGTTTAEDRFGITSFTFTARRPFHNERFTEVLKKWPVPKHTDLQLLLDGEPDQDHCLATVIRSKGFCWLAQEPDSRIYWSQAGKDMKLSYNGVWWAAMTEQQVKLMERLVGDEYQRARREDWHEEVGDRRQELVFIGQRMDEASIRSVLENCVLTDEEMDDYMQAGKAKDVEMSPTTAR